jgi:mannose-1-phosphate guanylyltransferase / mannose-6-phosphate isomerase
VRITPILLCGGSGTRLWPLSRKSYPKQFARLAGQDSLLQASARRLTGPAFAAPVVVTHNDLRFVVTEQLTSIGIDPGAILIEPVGRNTAPAVLAAVLYVAASDPDAVLLVAPADHVIPDAAAFAQAVQTGAALLDQGRIVTFGILPDRPETGYGYLRLESPPDGSGAPVALSGFVEKPDAARAAELLASGTHLWNAGIFLFRAADILAAFDAHAADLVAPVTAAVQGARADLGFLRLDPVAWAGVRDISIDYAVMEKSDRLSVVPFRGAWSDLGDWESVLRSSATDAAGVAVSDHATAIDCRDTLLRSEGWGEDGAVELVGIGLEGIIAVAMPDAVLVVARDRAQDVKRAVEMLKARKARQAEIFPRDFRPWGWFESLAMGGRFQVKRIHVAPGAALSLQSHVHRAEHWIVVQGTARVTVNEDIRLLTENQSVYIPLGVVHRLENPGKLPLTLIEVQTGAYLGEDDIIRYQDVYART